MQPVHRELTSDMSGCSEGDIKPTLHPSPSAYSVHTEITRAGAHVQSDFTVTLFTVQMKLQHQFLSILSVTMYKCYQYMVQTAAWIYRIFIIKLK